MREIPEQLAALAAAAPDSPAIFAAGESWTFAQLHDRVLARAEALRGLDIQPGHRVGIWLQKGLDQAALILAILEVDAVAVPIHTSFTPQQVRRIAADCEMTTPRGSSLSETGPLDPLGTDRARPAPGHVAGDPDRSAVLLYTAWDTDELLGIILSHLDLCHRGARTAARLEVQPEDRISGIVCLNLAFGLDHLWGALHAGAALYLHGTVFPSDTLEFISHHRLTVLPLLQVTAARLFHPRLLSPEAPATLPSVRRVSVTGGAVSPELLRQLGERFPRADIDLLYGLSETGSVAHQSAARAVHQTGAIGDPLPGVEILLLDDDGEPCRPGERGELVVCGATLARGYWNDEPATARRFQRTAATGGEAVVYTGDIGVIDPESGCHHLVGRKGGMIKSHGHRISPRQIEAAVIDCEGVSAAIAFGSPNSEIGEDIVVAYSTAGGQAIEPQCLTAHLSSRLPGFMQPRWSVHLQDLAIARVDGDSARRKIARRVMRRLHALAD